MSTFNEPHYRIVQLAKMWSMSQNTVLRAFKGEPGVLCWGNMNSKSGRKFLSGYLSRWQNEFMQD